VHEVFPVAETGQRETVLQHLRRHERRETTYFRDVHGLSAERDREEWTVDTPNGGTEFDGGPQNSEGPTALITAHPLLRSLMKLQQEHFQLAELEEPLQTCCTDLQAIWAETAR